MGYRKNLRNKIPGGFVALPWEILNSKAYIELKPNAGKALPYFLGKIKVKYSDPQRCVSGFHFSYKEANRLGFANSTHHRIIAELIAKGFIDPVDKGGLRGCGRSYNTFKLSQRWKDFGTPDFIKLNGWKAFKPKGL